MDDKQIKALLKKKAQNNPEKYYPINFLKEKGYFRKKCKKCGNYFWTLDPTREICGDPQCIGGYQFIGEKNTPLKLDFIAAWKIFSKIFKKLGYTPIKRYPVMARWRDDMDFVIASIADFQPYVVKGEVDPPANPLVVPQFCLRFTDIDNVGFTGRHYTGFVMIGQHAFVPPEKYDKEKYLSDIHYWLTKGMGIKEEEIIYHEDAWAGGGNLGPSMEFFAKGLEIGNQVYMQYEITNREKGEFKKLNTAVLDMGMGQERVAWFTHGTSTSYEANFPTVIEYLHKITGLKKDEEIWRKFLPYSALLNIDEVANIDKVWENIANTLSINKETLKEKIEPLAGIYAIAEHTRSLLVAISDGAIPSNVGGGYNLRVIARRIFDLIKVYEWNIDLYKVFEKHAKYLKEQYPELTENLENVKKIMDVEYKKYLKTKERNKQIIQKYKGKKITINDAIKLYDSYGISPAYLLENKMINKIPENFYKLVSEKHKEKTINKAQTKKDIDIDLKDIEGTKILYWGDWKVVDFEGKIVKIHKNYVVLDRTAFYPTSGGQMHDTGKIITSEGKEYEVIDVIKKDNYVVHVLKSVEGLKEGMKIKGIIDFDRRMQHTQHHTAAHILNLACRKVLGDHVWQAGAEKTTEKGRLDITHYEIPSFEQIQEIEKVANEIILSNIPIKKMVIRRDEAEKRYGFRIYQGGVPPGKYLRIVKVDEDVEACGGTHLNTSLETGMIKIISVNKIQDGIIRFEYVAGKRAIEYIQSLERTLKKSSEIFNVSYKMLPQTSKKFFEEWKKQRKEIERLKGYERKLLKLEIEKSIKEIHNLRVAEIIKEVNIKDIISIIKDIKGVDAVIVNSKNGKIIVSKGDAVTITKKILNVKDNQIKGKGNIVFVKE